MNEHVTIELDEDELARAHVAAEARGIAMEDYLKRLIAAHLPSDTPESQQKVLLAKIIGMGSSEHPTDIAKDRDKLIGEAVREEYRREPKQSAER
jgi:hypothetical protein